jgi:hypothetical protein
MKHVLVTVVTALCACASLVAQRPGDPAREAAIRQELERARAALQEKQAEADSLLDARVRHDMGLGGNEPMPMPGGEVAPAQAAAPALERAQLQLSQEEAVTASLHLRFEKLRKDAERHAAELAARRKATGGEPEWVVVPLAGEREVADPRARHVPQQPAQQDVHGADAHQPHSTDAQSQQDPVRIASNLQPIRARIDGSDDHGLVATALLRASQSLVDRADQLRAQGFGQAADEALDEAKARLSLAVEELQMDEKNKDSFACLFHLGRCRELLFRIAERREGLNAKDKPKEFQRREQEVRDAYVAITARDAVRKNGKDELGPWGRAAQSAMDHFRWMNLHSGYAPKSDPQSITWSSDRN